MGFEGVGAGRVREQRVGYVCDTTALSSEDEWEWR